MKEEIKMNNLIYQKNKMLSSIIRIGVPLFILLIASMIFLGVSRNKKPNAEVITTSKLQKIINVSELSTFQVVYNGIAKVMNKEDGDVVDYYVSYMSKVNAGIDFEQVKIDVDNDTKRIIATIPEIGITDINVDITSLDYLFYNDKAENATVSQEAYKACLEDVKNESSEEKEIYELAEENAKNILKALISPFVEQLDSDYVLEIN